MALPVPDKSTPYGRFERERLVWQPAGAASSFALDLRELLRPI
jgi:hypothetical protein